MRIDHTPSPTEQLVTEGSLMLTDSDITNARRVFAQCGLWAGAPADTIERLFDASEVEFHRAGSVALSKEELSRFIVVISGRVRASRQDSHGHEISDVSAVEGQQLGVIAAIHDRPARDEFVAAEPSVTVKVPTSELRLLMLEEPAVSYALALHFSERYLRMLDGYALRSADVHCRLAAHLISHPQATADNRAPVTIKLEMSRRELASVLGTVPATLSRAFARLREDGLIETEGRRVVTILDRKKLESVAP